MECRTTSKRSRSATLLVRLPFRGSYQVVCLDLEFSEGSHGKTLCDSQEVAPYRSDPLLDYPWWV